MERCLKVALSVVFLAACLQAKPVCQLELVNPLNVTYDPVELGLGWIDKSVTCGANVTFVSPNNVDVGCLAVALQSFKDGLEQAKANCNDSSDRINDTQGHMESREEGAERLCVTNAPLCQWSDKKPLREFLEDFRTLLALRNAAAQ